MPATRSTSARPASSCSRSRAASCIPGVRCAIGNGVVLDPETLFTEIERLVKSGVDVEGRLYVSDRAHLVLPYHKLVDAESSASRQIGTTGRGIGPAYEDKVARRGVRVLDLRHPAPSARARGARRRSRERAAGDLRVAEARGGAQTRSPHSRRLPRGCSRSRTMWA